MLLKDPQEPPDVGPCAACVGARVDVLRLLRIFKKHGVRATFFACAVALERNPTVGPAITAESHDVLGHGNRYQR